MHVKAIAVAISVASVPGASIAGNYGSAGVRDDRVGQYAATDDKVYCGRLDQAIPAALAAQMECGGIAASAVATNRIERIIPRLRQVFRRIVTDDDNPVPIVPVVRDHDETPVGFEETPKAEEPRETEGPRESDEPEWNEEPRETEEPRGSEEPREIGEPREPDGEEQVEEPRSAEESREKEKPHRAEEPRGSEKEMHKSGEYRKENESPKSGNESESGEHSGKEKNSEPSEEGSGEENETAAE